MTITREPYKAFAERVDGLILPAAVGGHPALDFCNTEAGWGTPEPGDYLRSYEYVVAWAKGAGLVEHDLADRIRRRAARNTAEASRALEEARAFRNSLHTVLLRPRPGADWDRVAALVREGAADAVLKPGAHVGHVGAARADRHAPSAARPGPVGRRAAHVRRGRVGPLLSREPLRVAVPGPQGKPAVVHDVDVRQPGQGPPVRPAPAVEARYRALTPQEGPATPR